MFVLGVESSCDECSVAVVEDGKRILSNEIATQIDFHRPFNGVVPEIASRMHTEWISSVARRAGQWYNVSRLISRNQIKKHKEAENER